MSLVDVSLFPDSLKKIKPYLIRANEICKKNPNVAYFCLTYALNLGIELTKTTLKGDTEGMTALGNLMDDGLFCFVSRS